MNVLKSNGKLLLTTANTASMPLNYTWVNSLDKHLKYDGETVEYFVVVRKS